MGQGRGDPDQEPIARYGAGDPLSRHRAGLHCASPVAAGGAWPSHGNRGFIGSAIVILTLVPAAWPCLYLEMQQVLM